MADWIEAYAVLGILEAEVRFLLQEVEGHEDCEYRSVPEARILRIGEIIEQIDKTVEVNGHQRVAHDVSFRGPRFQRRPWGIGPPTWLQVEI